ncbi:hypothetical protein GCM10027402_09210 [Arthrobacter monumenti]
MLAAPVLLGFSVPLIGVVASLFLLPLIAHRVRLRLWPRSSARATIAWSVLALIGLWLPALLTLFSQGAIPLGGPTVWLLIPLCAPGQLSTLIIPALAATAAVLAGAGVGALARHPWPWVVGAWIAPMAYIAASRWLVDGTFYC